jgi:hypothetical protein
VIPSRPQHPCERGTLTPHRSSSALMPSATTAEPCDGSHRMSF